jgi:diguanylate cyclase (GGDEF)-like protein
MLTRYDDDDPRDEGRLADLTSAGMWLTAGVVGTAILALPGSSREHLGAALLIGALATIWGLASLTLYVHGWTMKIGVRAIVTAGMAPLVALSLWASGGASSFLQPLLLFTALFVAYFFPVRLAWPLVALFAVAYSSPLFYDDGAIDQGYPARAVAFAFALVGATVAMQLLKRRLLVAEERQRVMAERDPLTGLYNRRSFDAALDDMVATPDGGALVLFDFDAFKAINDEHGHPVGDAVLRAVAHACQRVVRDRDCLARIGGDEFALIAPRAAHVGVARIVTALEDAIAEAALPDGIYRVNASFAWAVAPTDAAGAGELLECADQRLLYRKRLLKSAF